MEIALLSEKLFKDNSPIKEDTVISKFVPYIIIAQKMNIRDVLGKPLYRQLQAQIKATDGSGVNSITPANKALIQQIAPALSLFAIYQGLPLHWMSIINKGVTIGESENSGAVTFTDLNQARRFILNHAEFMLKDLIDYLCDCRAQYPLFIPGNQCGDGCGKEKKKTNSGIFFPR